MRGATRKELDDIMDQHNLTPQSRIRIGTVREIINKQFRHGGLDQENRELFNVFDKRGRGIVTPADLKTTL
jgi:Ca2+-binding EF-hand superfamily protein